MELIDHASGLLERRIVTGMIVSKRFLNEVSTIYKPSYLQSPAAKHIAKWCLKYYQTYQKAPKHNIRDLLYKKIKTGLEEALSKDIENILDTLSNDYDPEQFNIDYLIDETEEYFKQRSLIELSSLVKEYAEKGENLDAESEIAKYANVSRVLDKSIDPIHPDTKDIREAFEQSNKPLIQFPGALGMFMNPEMTRESFIGFMGPEKVGKTFTLIELAFRALRSGSNVVFFEAGDMTRAQVVRRQGIYLAKRSDREIYCQEMFIPVLDCKFNQLDECNKKYRTCDHGVFTDETWDDVLIKSFEDYITVYETEPNYVPCRYCDKYGKKSFRGAIWYQHKEKVDPLTWREAYRNLKWFGKTIKRKFRLYTYPNDTLKVSDMESELTILERNEGWSPDVIIVDYADLLVTYNTDAERDKQNRIWKQLRSLSQKRKCLVVTATQADAASYDKRTLSRKNFSEDKRKYAHVSCMFGLQQTIDEKRKGIMRINRLVVRDDYFEETQCVKVLQQLKIGRPFLGSYF